MPVDLENFIRSIEDDGIARGRAAVASHKDAALEFEGEDRGRLRLRNFGAWRRRTD
jgi:hypothetical protein